MYMHHVLENFLLSAQQSYKRNWNNSEVFSLEMFKEGKSQVEFYLLD